jgi:hypothetical protein
MRQIVVPFAASGTYVVPQDVNSLRYLGVSAAPGGASGGGGCSNGQGGGSGGTSGNGGFVATATLPVVPGETLTIVIGVGGAGAPSANADADGTIGGNPTATTITGSLFGTISLAAPYNITSPTAGTSPRYGQKGTALAGGAAPATPSSSGGQQLGFDYTSIVEVGMTAGGAGAAHAAGGGGGGGGSVTNQKGMFSQLTTSNVNASGTVGGTAPIVTIVGNPFGLFAMPATLPRGGAGGATGVNGSDGQSSTTPGVGGAGGGGGGGNAAGAAGRGGAGGAGGPGHVVLFVNSNM